MSMNVWTTEFVVGFAESLVVLQNATMTIPPLWLPFSGRVEVCLLIGITTKCSWIACDEFYDQPCTLVFVYLLGVEYRTTCNHGGASTAVSWTGITEEWGHWIALSIEIDQCRERGQRNKLSANRWNIVEFFYESCSSALLFPWIRDCDFYAEIACCVRECGGIGAADDVRLFF